MADSNRHRPQHNNIRRRDHLNEPSNPNKSSISNNVIMHNYIDNIKPSSSRSNFNDDEETNIPSLIGTCSFMCPVEERQQRERLRDLAVFERLHGDPKKSSPDLAVKKFCRTITAQNLQASDLRPLSVLKDTLDYLLNLLHSSDYPFEVIHDFIFDRTRSIRQDLGMQNLSNDQVIFMYEKIIRFHIISEHKFRGNTNMSSKSYLNMEQLTKTLITLYNLYEANQSMYQNEAEFRSLYVLLHLHSDIQRESLLLWFRNIPSNIIKSKEMRFALTVLRYFRLGNYKRFMSIVESEASYLQYCILEPYISEVRALAISCVNYGAYKVHPYPLIYLSKVLMMKESDLESMCKDCGLKTSSDEVGSVVLPPKQTSFSYPKQELRNYYPLESQRIQKILIDMSELQ